MANLDLEYGIDDRVAAFRSHEQGRLVCLAGPGTGKTYSFLERIEALTTEHAVSVDAICYLTFIKEISRAFVADYEDNTNVSEKPRISTLHSFACRLIRNQGFQIGYDGTLYFMSLTDVTDSAKVE